MPFPRFNLEHFENSLGAERKKLSTALDKMCSETGFLVIEGHGVPQKVIDDQWAIVSEFFSSSLEIKKEVKVPYKRLSLRMDWTGSRSSSSLKG